MAKDDADHTTLSSIALLQERFRQLQRMKELRQERELMRSLSECKTSPPVAPVVAAQPHCQLALSLWPDSQTERAGSWTPLDHVKPYHSPPQFNLETSHNDIDTSLRL